MARLLVLLVVVAVAISAAAALDPTTFPMPKYTVNLDQKPYYRWQHIAKLYSAEIHQSIKVLHLALTLSLVHLFVNIGPSSFRQTYVVRL